MCDPVSLAGLAFAIGSTCAKLSITLIAIARATEGAPAELARLETKLSTLSVTLSVLEKALRAAGDGMLKPQLCVATRNIINRFKEVTKQLRKYTSSASKKSQRFKWFFDQSKVNDLLLEVESIKSSLTLVLSVVQFAESQKERRSDKNGHRVNHSAKRHFWNIAESVVEANRTTVENAQRKTIEDSNRRGANGDIKRWSQESSDTATWLYRLVFVPATTLPESHNPGNERIVVGGKSSKDKQSSTSVSEGEGSGTSIEKPPSVTVEDGRESGDGATPGNVAEVDNEAETRTTLVPGSEESSEEIMKPEVVGEPSEFEPIRGKAIEWNAATEPHLVINRLLHEWTYLEPMEFWDNMKEKVHNGEKGRREGLIARIQTYVDTQGGRDSARDSSHEDTEEEEDEVSGEGDEGKSDYEDNEDGADEVKSEEDKSRSGALKGASPYNSASTAAPVSSVRPYRGECGPLLAVQGLRDQAASSIPPNSGLHRAKPAGFVPVVPPVHLAPASRYIFPPPMRSYNAVGQLSWRPPSYQARTFQPPVGRACASRDLDQHPGKPHTPQQHANVACDGGAKAGGERKNKDEPSFQAHPLRTTRIMLGNENRIEVREYAKEKMPSAINTYLGPSRTDPNRNRFSFEFGSDSSDFRRQSQCSQSFSGERIEAASKKHTLVFPAVPGRYTDETTVMQYGSTDGDDGNSESMQAANSKEHLEKEVGELGRKAPSCKWVMQERGIGQKRKGACRL